MIKEPEQTEDEIYDPCIWIDRGYYWDTKCGGHFNAENGVAPEFKYCMYCGKEIQKGFFVTREMYEGFGFGV